MNEMEEEIGTAFALVRKAFAMRWKRIALFAIGGATVLGGVAFLLPRSYVGRVLLLPVEQNATSSLRGFASNLAELYMGSAVGTDLTRALPDIVKSRAFIERLLAAEVRVTTGGRPQRLLDLVEPRGRDEIRIARAVKAIRKRLDAGLDRRTGTFSLSARFDDGQTAADIANTGATLLQDAVNDLFTSQASQERSFLEERIADTQNRLRLSEDQLRGFRERNVRVSGSPRLVLEEGRLVRAVREQEQVYLTLRDQYELARIGETRRIPSIRIVDPAIPPIEHDWPPRRMFALGGVLLGGVIGMVDAVRRQRNAQLHGNGAGLSPA